MCVCVCVCVYVFVCMCVCVCVCARLCRLSFFENFSKIGQSPILTASLNVEEFWENLKSVFCSRLRWYGPLMGRSR